MGATEDLKSPFGFSCFLKSMETKNGIYLENDKRLPWRGAQVKATCYARGFLQNPTTFALSASTGASKSLLKTRTVNAEKKI